MNTTRRTRGDSVLTALPVEQRDQVEIWLMVERLPLREVQRKLKDEFGVVVCHDTVARHERRLRQEDSVATFKESLAAAHEVPGKLKEDGAALLEASMLLLRQQAFDCLSTGDGAPEMLERMGRLLLRAAEVEVSEHRVRVSEYRAQEKVMVQAMAQAEELRPIWAQEGLSDGERFRAGMMRIFGYLDPKNMELYQKDLAEQEARKCPTCQHVRAKHWERLEELEALKRNVREGKPCGGQEAVEGGTEPMQKEECRIQNEEKPVECGVAKQNPNDECRNPKENLNPNGNQAGGSDTNGTNLRELVELKEEPIECGTEPMQKEECRMQNEGGKKRKPKTKSTPHPDPVTHSRPLVRPEDGPSLSQIPFAASQAAQVPDRGGEGGEKTKAEKLSPRAAQMERDKRWKKPQVAPADADLPDESQPTLAEGSVVPEGFEFINGCYRRVMIVNGQRIVCQPYERG